MRVIAIMMVTILSACTAVWAEITAVQDVAIVARLTGADSINSTNAVGVGGTDLGHMVNHNGTTYFLFGDTYSGGTSFEGGCWRSNVVAYSTDTTPSDGIVFDGWITGPSVCGHPGWAREVIAYDPFPPTITEIPSGAVSLGNRIYAWYLAIDSWGDPGKGNWTGYCRLAYWQVGDPTFTMVPGFQFAAASNFGQVVANLRTDLPPGEDDYLYLWGTTSGRTGGVKLARVLPASVTELSAYRYFAGLDNAGQPTWVSNEFTCPLIVPAPVGEMSVMYNQAASAWTMMYFNQDNYAIEFRESPSPWGPWSSPITVTTGQEFPGLYAPYMNPLYVEQDGQIVYFTMSLWDPYDVYLMKARLALAPKGCGRGVGMANLAVFWTCCFAWLVTQKIRYRRTHQ